MNTRIVEEVEVFYLMLNPVTANAECVVPVVASYSPILIQEWYDNQKAEDPYRENGYYLVFKSDSHIKMFNPSDHFYDTGIKSAWLPLGGEVQCFSHDVIWV